MSILLSADGSHTLLSEKYGVTYHSKHGAVTESAHVFIEAGLHWKSAVNNVVSILEVGFGSGLNAFMTWLEAERLKLPVRYTTLETDPITAAAALELNYPDALQAPERARDFLSLHDCAWDTTHALSPFFTFEKKQMPLQHFEASRVFDLIYFDAFAPQAQPELWEETIFQKLAQALLPGGGLVTYCAQGEFRRRLRRAGFQTERLPGPPGKREMTRAQLITDV